MGQNFYMHVVPNSHAYGSLRNFIVSYKYHAHRTEELTPEYILIGLKNTIKKGSKLQQLTFPNGAQGPCFHTIENIIEYVESSEWSLKEFIITIENTLKNGFDLKYERKMKREEVYKLIDGERDYQDFKWDQRRGEDEVADKDKAVAEWLNYMSHHLSAAQNRVYYLNKEEALEEIRKVVALGICALEIHGCPERKTPKDLLDT